MKDKKRVQDLEEGYIESLKDLYMRDAKNGMALQPLYNKMRSDGRGPDLAMKVLMRLPISFWE